QPGRDCGRASPRRPRDPGDAHDGSGVAVVAGGQAVPPIALLLLLPLVTGAAQAVPNRTTLYLHPTDVTDARALWVNPAGLARMMEASAHLDLTVGDPGAGGRLRQTTVGVSSRGFSFGYQRDLFDGGVRGHTYRLGFAAGERRLAAGAATVPTARGDRGGSRPASRWASGTCSAPSPPPRGTWEGSTP